MSRGKHRKTARDGSQFALLPYVVLDSPGYLGLPHPARSLLLELVRQYRGSNNGKLVLCDKYLAPRGWKSSDVINRAKRQLLDAGLIQETRKGQRPNKAAWYALTWLSLDLTPEMDIQRNGFERGAYLQNKKRPPPDGVESSQIAPSNGVRAMSATPSDGAMQGNNVPSPTPSNGDYLDIAICTDSLDGGEGLRSDGASPAQDEGDAVWVLDADQSGIWDEVTGEFVPAPTKQTGSARAWAQAELARLTGCAAPYMNGVS